MTWRCLWLAMLMTVAVPVVCAAQCSISTSGVAFGNYDTLAPAAVDVAGSVTYSCLLIVLPRVTLGTGSSGAFGTRTMKKGAEVLTYNLYTNAARTVIWGDGSPGTGQYAPLLSLLGATLPVYARLPPKQSVTAGPYTDTVVATLFF